MVSRISIPLVLEVLEFVVGSPFFWFFTMGVETCLGVLAFDHVIRLRWIILWTVFRFAALCVHLYVRYVSGLTARPTTREWFEMEERFGMIDDELEGLWEIHSTRKISWMAWPKHQERPRAENHGRRSTKRFEFEAMHAGKMLRRAGYAVSGFPVESGADGFDYWMSALASDVPRESDIRGDGLDGTADISIRSKSGHIDNVIHASKFLCAKMAREQSI